jgi:hypothetical protein
MPTKMDKVAERELKELQLFHKNGHIFVATQNPNPFQQQAHYQQTSTSEKQTPSCNQPQSICAMGMYSNGNASN